MFSRVHRSLKDQVELTLVCDGTEYRNGDFLRNAISC